MIPDANSYNTDTFKELFIKLDDFSEIYDIKELRLLFTGIITELLIKLSHSNWQKRTDTVLDNDITSIVKYINENIRSSFTLQDLCGKFDLSQTTLYNNFHTYMKVPIMKYIREKKIIQANQLILKGEKPMAVATSFGYADYSSFYRSFVSVMGFAPSQHNKNSDD